MTRLDFLWLLLVGVASSAWCLTAGRELGATFDEPFYVAKGLEAWRTGSNRSLMRAGTMPLPVDVQTLPLHVWERVRGEPFDPVSDLPKLLPAARGMNLVFWWPLLVYAGLLARLWGGAWAGWLTVGLVGCEPNLLAHAALATTDIALTAGVLAAVYHFAVGRGGPWRRRVLIPGVAAGLAVACKASAVTFVPLAWVVINLTPRPPLQGGEGEKIQHPLPPPLRVGEGAGGWGLRDLLASALVAAVVLFAYCGCDWATEPSFVKWAIGLPDGSFADAMRFTADHLRIFPNAGEGIVQQVKHNMRGHGSYVIGEYHPRAVWYYFPVVLSAKLTEPLLLLLAGLLILRPRALLNPAGWIAVAYLLFSLTCRVQIGVRLVFPLVVMLNVAAAVALFSPSPLWRGGRGGGGAFRSQAPPLLPHRRVRLAARVAAHEPLLGWLTPCRRSPYRFQPRLGPGTARTRPLARRGRRTDPARLVLRHRPGHPPAAVPCVPVEPARRAVGRGGEAACRRRVLRRRKFAPLRLSGPSPWNFGGGRVVKMPAARRPGRNLRRLPPRLMPPTPADFADALVLTGPTGSGKSAVALDLAERLGCEIVAMDSMTLYRGMDVGTAKPTPAERARVTHHLIDVLDPWESGSVAWWLNSAADACAQIRSSGKRPLFVGGTPFYLKALTCGLFDAPPVDPQIRADLEAEADQNGPDSLHRRLAEVDPVAAARLHPNDVRRVVRALEVFAATGRPISSFQQTWDTPEAHARIPCVMLDWPRDELYCRIDARVDVMLAAGWLDEVRALAADPRGMGKEANQALGYRELRLHLNNGGDWAATVTEIKSRTRQFAKRQLTWFRHLPECVPVAANQPRLAEWIAQNWPVQA